MVINVYGPWKLKQAERIGPSVAANNVQPLTCSLPVPSTKGGFSIATLLGLVIQLRVPQRQ